MSHIYYLNIWIQKKYNKYTKVKYKTSKTTKNDYHCNRLLYVSYLAIKKKISKLRALFLTSKKWYSIINKIKYNFLHIHKI